VGNFWDYLKDGVSNTVEAAKSAGQAAASTGQDFYHEMYWGVVAAEAAVGADRPGELTKARAAAFGTPEQQAAAKDTNWFDAWKGNANASTAAVGHVLNVATSAPVINTATDALYSGMEGAYRAGTSATIVGGRWSDAFSPENWQRAWNATSNDNPAVKGVTFGEAITSNSPEDVLDPAKLAQNRADVASSWQKQLLVEGLDVMGWLAFDPTKGVGRVARAARVANRIETSAQAEKAFEASKNIEFGDAKGARHDAQAWDFLTPKGMGGDPSAKAHLDTIDRFIIKHTEQSKFSKSALPSEDEMASSLKRVARNGAGEGTANVILGLFSQANKIEEVTHRLATKRNIMFASQGSKGALQALIHDSPEIARAMERMSRSPEGIDRLDELAHASLDPTRNFSDLAERVAFDKNNADELKGFAKRLDDFHGNLSELDARLYGSADSGGGGQFNTVAGLSAFDKLAAGLHARVGHAHVYQDGVGARTMRAVGWATDKVAPGTINSADALTGAEQFGGTLRQAGYSAAEVTDLQNRFRGLGQNERNILVKNEMGRMVRRIAAKYGMDEELAKRVTNNIMSKLVDGRAFASRELERIVKEEEANAATAANERLRTNAPKGLVKLHEPGGQTAISVKHGLLQSHMGMSAPTLDPRLVEKVIRYHSADAKTGLGALRERGVDLGSGLADAYTNIWKFGVLGRPGLAVRALLDTQLRSVAMIGAMTTFLQTAQGTGHVLDRRLLKSERMFTVPATVEDLKQAAYHDSRAEALTAQLNSWGSHDTGNAFFKDESAAYKDAQGKPLRSPKIDAFAERNQLRRDQLFERQQDLQSKLETLRGRRPKTVKQQARNEELIARAEARVARITEQLKQAYDPTKAAKDARLGYLKGNAGHRANRSREGDLRSAIAAHRVTAESLRAGTYRASKNWLGTQKKPMTLVDGQKVQLSPAYTSAHDMDSVTMLLSHGGNAASSVLTGSLASDTGRIREMNNSWVANVKANDPEWSRRYVRAVDAMLASPTARRLMHSRTLRDERHWNELYQTMRNDKAVKNEWAKMKAHHTDFDTWLHGIVRYVGYYAPTEKITERILRGERLTPEGVDGLIPKGERFTIHGPDLEYLQPSSVSQAAVNARDKIFKLLLDKPDTYLVRHPTYVALYNQNAKRLANKWARERGDLTLDGRAEIEARARHQAIVDIKRVMYDPSHLTNAHQTLRFISPFIRPWEDAMRSWSRLIYDNPNVLGRMALAWQAPNIAGIIVDENGHKVPAWSAPKDGRQEFAILPVPFGDKTGIHEFRLRKQSLNSIAQGDTPWLPGFGPVVQVPVQALASDFFPEIYNYSNNPVLRSMFPDGNIPKSGAKDILWGQAPGYARALHDAFDAKAGSNARIYQTVINAKILEAQQKGLPPPSPEVLKEAGRKAARTGGLIRALASGLIGMSGTSSPEGNFYVEQYQTLRAGEAYLLKTQGKTADQAFAELYPEAADLPWSISMNETGINATVRADKRSRSLKKLIDQFPEFGYAIVGSDNVGGQFARDGSIMPDTQFNSSVYNAQFGIKYGVDELGRRGRTQGEILDRALQATGWTKYAQVSAAVDVALQQRGLNNLNQKGAQQIRLMKQLLVAKLKKDNPVWAADFEDRNGGKVDQFLRVADVLMSNPRTKDREDINALRTYLQYRDTANKLAQAQGYTLKAVKNADPLRKRLYEIGSALAKQSLGFDQVWQRVLEGEVEDRNAAPSGSDPSAGSTG